MKVLIPISKGKQKVNIRGFWYSKDTKKTYYDYIKIITVFSLNDNVIEDLRRTIKEALKKYWGFLLKKVGYLWI